MITESNGREIFIGQRAPWEIDEQGRLVLTLKQAKALAEHLTWQFESDSEHVLIHGTLDEDG